MSASKMIFGAIVAIVLPLLTLGQEVAPASKEPFRLPGDIFPLQQWVTIYTSLVESDYSFYGSTTIKIECAVETTQIILHSSKLTIGQNENDVSVAYWTDSDAIQTIGIQSWDLNEEYEFLIITLSEALVVGTQYSVFISFSAPLEDACYGYVRTSYVDEETGATYWFASTYMDAGAARTVFPCLDEPGMKTVFSISLAHLDTFQSLSNMPIRESYYIDGMDGWVMDVYEDSPPLCTYLVAILVSQFDYIELQNMPVPVRIYARKDSINKMRMVEEAATRVFPYLNDLLGFPYPLPKLDIVAVPLLLAATESFGCVMTNEAEVLYNPDMHTIYEPTEIAADISHLIAHQWFGDLVSIFFWDEVWLFEGIAFFFQEIGLAHFMSLEIYLDIRFVSIHRTEMNDDSLVPVSQALVAPIEDPKNLLQNLTYLSYRKSFFVLRMLNAILGPEAFMQGIKNYIQVYQYGVATQFDFLYVMNTAGLNAQTLPQDVDLNLVMEAWTKTKGYPIVTVSVNVDDQIAYLSQTRFFSETGITAEERQEGEKQCWPIPINFTTRQSINFDNILPELYLTCETDGALILENITVEDWVIVNLKAMVPARINYDQNNWNLIAQTLLSETDFTTIDVMNRMQIVSDSLEIAWPGIILYEIPFSIVPYLRMESMEQPWRTGLVSLRDIRNRLKRTDMLESYHYFVRTFIESKYSELGSIEIVPDDILEARFKLLISTWACTYGVKAALEQSLNVVMQWYNTAEPDSNNPININVRDIVYCYAIQEADKALWDWMFERFVQSTDNDEKSRLLYGLGCSRDPNILAEFLQWSLDPNRIDPIWSSTVFFSVYYNELPISFDVIFNFLIDNFQNICTALGENTGMLCSYVSFMGDLIESSEELQQFQTFLDLLKSQGQSCDSDITTAIRYATNNIAWHDLHNQEISQLLAKITETFTSNV